MSEKLNIELKKPIELDMDLENNQKELNRDIEKFEPMNGYYKDKNQTNNVDETKKDETKVDETNEDGFHYEKKSPKGEKNDLDMEESEISRKNEDNDQNTRGTKLNPKLEQITEPEPEDKKKANYLSSNNKRNRNQPL